MNQQQESPGPEPSARARAQIVTICIGLALLVAAIYGQTLGFEFVLYDDPDYVTENPRVRDGLTSGGIRWAMTAMHASNWHPLTWVSHMLDYQLFGGDPAGHHLSNVLLHTINTLLLFILFQRLTGDIWPSAFVAALFAAHPLHVESVAWVAERKDVLSTLFFLLAILCYVGYASRGGIARYLGVAILFLLGLMAKPMVVTLPLVLLLIDYWPLRRHRAWPGLIVEKLPLFALSGATALMTVAAQRAGGSMEATDLVPFYLRIVNATVSYVRYVVKILWPTDLSVLYPHPNLAGGTPWSAWELGLAGSLLVITTALVVVVSSRHRYVGAGWFFFVITLAPVIGLVQVGQQAIADRYTYVPSIGLFVIIAWGAREWLLSRGGPKRVEPAAVGLAAFLVIVMMATLAWKQTRYWRDSVTLFERALAVSAPTPIMLSNLGVALAGQRRMEEAIECHRKALEIKPDYGRAHNNLGVALQLTGRLDEAVQHYRWALEIDPGSASAHNNLGSAMRNAGRPEEALVHYRQSLAINPRSARTHLGLANALRDAGRREQAAEHYRRALEIDPSLERARTELESVLVGGP